MSGVLNPRRRAAAWCSRRSRRPPSGQREPPGLLPRPRRGADHDAEPAAADISTVDADVDSGAHRVTAATDRREHEAGDGSQARSCSREPPGGNQDLGRSEDAATAGPKCGISRK
jgi:hypothetical protein